MIIWADPTQKDKIIEKTTQDKKGQTVRQKEIDTKQVAVDPKYPLFPKPITRIKLRSLVPERSPI